MTTTQERPARSVTIDDVARRANVSRQTVSRVLNEKGEIAPATRARIQQLIDEMGYRPNLLARSLITRTTNTVGLVVPDISNPFFPEIARGIKERAHAAGYHMLLAHTAEDPMQEVESLRQFRERRVDGVIVANSRLDDAALAAALRGIAPVVLTNRTLRGSYGSVIWPGYRPGARLVTEHLLGLGRQRVGYVDAEPRTTAGQERFLGYREALEAAGVAFDERLVACGPATGGGGCAAANQLLRLPNPPSAIFAYNDTMAIGVLRACLLAGRAIPDDVAVVGFGGAPLSAWVTPSLTTVEVPLYEIGRAAAEALLLMLQEEPPRTRTIPIEPVLVVRESSRGEPTTPSVTESA